MKFFIIYKIPAVSILLTSPHGDNNNPPITPGEDNPSIDSGENNSSTDSGEGNTPIAPDITLSEQLEAKIVERLNTYGIIDDTNANIELWEENKTYAPNSIVFKDNTVYRVLGTEDATGIPNDDGSPWRAVAKIDPTAYEEYNPSASYGKNEIVVKDGVVYISHNATTSEPDVNSNNWQLYYDNKEGIYAICGDIKCLAWRNDQVYDNGEYVVYKGAIYKAQGKIKAGTIPGTGKWILIREAE